MWVPKAQIKSHDFINRYRFKMLRHTDNSPPASIKEKELLAFLKSPNNLIFYRMVTTSKEHIFSPKTSILGI